LGILTQWKKIVSDIEELFECLNTIYSNSWNFRCTINVMDLLTYSLFCLPSAKTKDTIKMMTARSSYRWHTNNHEGTFS
jgi:outer membrane receptor for ferric coprogen and ferric-rhodotorulic acid